MKTISTKSLDDYRKIFLRLTKDSASPEDVLKRAQDTTSKNTWFMRRAAILHICKTKEYIAKQRLSVDVLPHEALQYTESYLERLRQLFEDATAISERTARHSKRQDMKRLPADWKERIWMEQGLHSYRLPYAVCAITGCRPSELKNGVQIKVESDTKPAKLIAIIKGAKIGVAMASGQPERRMEFDYTPGENRFIDFTVKAWMNSHQDENGFLMISIENQKIFSAAINRASIRLEMGGERGLTASCLRHSFASDLKRSGKSKSEIAMNLGNQSEKSQTYLGQARMSNGNAAVPQRVIAGKKVRPVKAGDVTTRLGGAVRNR